ncbi:LysE family translocator [Flexibacterium corallicola]|uniref:LysE family translocator n=1 Tax=Flexibacterium corallicola TaxID=3037259 RepID=UPI00286F1442|nr:LysE family translocator [Pseudovibrio sp. M1P-2-3]
MSLELWAVFALSSIVLLVIPGPTVIMIISYALGQGRHTASFCVTGTALGDLLAMTLSLMGAGTILVTSPDLFMFLKFVGAAYLVWLGLRMWRIKPISPGDIQGITLKTTRSHIFTNSFLVTAFNPKSIIFFTTIVPQFIDPTGDIFLQFSLLEMTFISLAVINNCSWAYLAGTMRKKLQNISTLHLINRIGGSFLICAGVIIATLQKGF